MAGVGLIHCDAKRIAILVVVAQSSRVLRGVASYERHATLGNVLRIPIDGEEGDLEFLFSERLHRGRIDEDTRYGCDYCVRLEMPA